MKIGFINLPLSEGKRKYHDKRMDALIEKDKPKKVTPFYVEFIKNDLVHSDALIISKDSILDLLIPDIEKCEIRIERSDDKKEIETLQKCIEHLEKEIPLCNNEFTSEEQEHIEKLAPLSYKPVVLVDEPSNENDLIVQALKKASIIFFYTSGPKEVHAWPIKQGSDIITCAGKIHSDLARGFIKGDVISFNDYLTCHNFNDGRKKKLVKVVEKEYIVEDGEIIEIRFNV